MTNGTLALYGTRQIGFATLGQVEGHMGSVLPDGYATDNHTPTLATATEAVHRGINQLVGAGVNGKVAIMIDRKVPGGRQPTRCIVDCGNVPPFGSLTFVNVGPVC